jgi:hypothetical protein
VALPPIGCGVHGDDMNAAAAAKADAVRRAADVVMVDESSVRYPGWRVAGASAVGVFVSFASLLVYTFGIFLKPMADEFSWSREAWVNKPVNPTRVLDHDDQRRNRRTARRITSRHFSCCRPQRAP